MAIVWRIDYGEGARIASPLKRLLCKFRREVLRGRARGGEKKVIFENIFSI